MSNCKAQADALVSALIDNNNSFTAAIVTFLPTNKRSKISAPSDPSMVGITWGQRTNDHRSQMVTPVCSNAWRSERT